MKSNNNYAVIMAGGIGSRFWPMSTTSKPKQFLDILGTGETLIQQTFNRIKRVCPVENIFIVTNHQYKNLCLKQLSEILNENILCEPAMRNTAPCIAYAAFKIHSLNSEANMIVAASDHIISKEDDFVRIVRKSLEIVESTDILLTLGIKPSQPHTGYGYIQFTTDELENNPEIKKVKTFTEKPNQELALSFLDSGDFLWNSGMFVWSVNAIILSFRKHLRDMYDIFSEGHDFYNSKDEKDYIERIFPSCKNISIDYGVMEKSNNVYVYPTDFGWSDLGTWSSLSDHLSTDKNKNSVQGNDVLLYNCSNNVIDFPNNKTVVLQGLEGYIIVEHEDSLLICKKEDEQEIKTFVSDLKRLGKDDKV